MDGKKNKTALICWELGGGLGHITPIIALAKHLLIKDYQIVIAAKDLSHQGLLQNDKVLWLQAPQLPKTAPTQSLSSCFSETLLKLGYSSPNKLTKVINDWLVVYQKVKPSHIFFDFSPSAQLAFFNKSDKKILIGSTFSDPYIEQGINGLYDSNKSAIAQKHQELLLENISIACRTTQITPPKDFNDIYSVLSGRIYFTIEELDHFKNRKKLNNQFYIGSITHIKITQSEWPAPDINNQKTQKKIFAYISADELSNSLLQALILSKHSCLICMKSKNPINFELPSHIHITNKPMDINTIISECDLIITNASSNVTTEVSMAGIRHIVWPTMLEQKILADIAIEAKLAQAMDPTSPERIALQINRELKRNSSIRLKMKEKYKEFNSKEKLQSALLQIGV